MARKVSYIILHNQKILSRSHTDFFKEFNKHGELLLVISGLNPGLFLPCGSAKHAWYHVRASPGNIVCIAENVPPPVNFSTLDRRNWRGPDRVKMNNHTAKYLRQNRLEWRCHMHGGTHKQIGPTALNDHQSGVCDIKFELCYTCMNIMYAIKLPDMLWY